MVISLSIKVLKMYRRRRAGFGLFLLLGQLSQVGHIPPVTLAVIALNTVVYLRLLQGLPSVSQACISFHHVWYNDDWRRIILSPFFHLDDTHLYFNMASFLWKGISLERSLGSVGLFRLVAVFSLLTSFMLLALDKCFSIMFDDPSYLYTCAAGFSGVLFALKVVTTYQLPPGTTHVMMLSVPHRMAYWVELILIKLLVPNSSFTGHLAGILVGLLYVKGPLKTLMDSIGNIYQDYPAQPTGPSYTYHSGTAGETRGGQHRIDEDDEQVQAAIQESLQEMRQNTSEQRNNAEELSNEELIRRRRLQRFQN